MNDETNRKWEGVLDLENGSVFVFDADRKRVCSVGDPCGILSETLKNAMLIVAAPELLAALAGMVDMFERHIEGRPGPDDAAMRWDAARSAISKATKGAAQ